MHAGQDQRNAESDISDATNTDQPAVRAGLLLAWPIAAPFVLWCVLIRIAQICVHSEYTNEIPTRIKKASIAGGLGTTGGPAET